jgi:hypothetical protein
MVAGATIESSKPMGESGKHFKICLEGQRGRLFVKAWNFEQRLEEIAAGSRVDAAVCIEEDDYWGWSVTLREVRSAA